MREGTQDLVIIGGGIMGLCTAYYAAQFSNSITILEKSAIGNTGTASFCYTRSIRNDYLDPLYARLAYESRRLWLELQRKAPEPFLIECGCLNIASERVTPDLSVTYAVQSYQTLTRLHLLTELLTRDALQQRFPHFDADLGCVDVEAGFLFVPIITDMLLAALKDKHVRIIEGVDVAQISQRANELHLSTNVGEYSTASLVITAGLGTNDVLRRIEGCQVQFPLIPDRPQQCKYFIPPLEKRALFTPERLPVFAYLDVGIYGHPICVGKTPGVKIGYYHPPDVRMCTTNITDVYSFVNECLPSLGDAEAVDVTEVDQCFYDLVADDTFILGVLPGYPQISVGVGWRGTGYKFAPWVGRTLMQLALEEGTVYNIGCFSPHRFV